MESSVLWNSIGLVFDIIGVTLLFFYEPPKESHGMLLQSAPSQEERDRAFNRKRKFSKLGLLALIVGFSLQIVSNFQ